ncbi:MAG: DUF885 family protein [Proteobacteria bacterium]|nr:DUF885 family protein [Pseudomonadota bacterium]MBW3617100.1 DUF885 family protein [Pseudomonadota bacterium]
MRSKLLLLAFAGVLTATPPAHAQGSPALQGVIADFEAYERRENPIAAGQEGDRAALSRLPETTPAANARRRAALEAFRGRLAAIPTASLAGEERTNHAFLSRIVAEGLESLSFDSDRLAIDFEGGPGQMLAYLADTTTLRDVSDAEAWIARLDAAERLYAENTANARRGLAGGWVQPKPVVDSALGVLRAEAAFEPATDPLLKPFSTLPATVAAAEKARLLERGRAIVATEIAPARRAYLRFIESEYLPKARAQVGAASLPNGKRYYAFQTRYHTTTDLTPDQIHALGQSEVRRIRAEMDGVMRETGFKGTFPEFLAFLRSDRQFYAQSREDLLEKASEMAKRADGGLPALFATLPRLPYTVKPTPREVEAASTTGRYYQGSPTLGVAGTYIVNTGNLPARPLYELPALTVHEAVPGHHLQIALSQELGEQPWFRRNANVTAFTEGWGLYSEFLGIEMGMYRTPYERFGKLSYEMWRACRLVADTGMHWLGWTKEQARACFTDNSALSAGNIEAELNRYIGWPGQALAYKVGELKLKELRRKAETALGARFDVRRFHDAVLLGGPVPLNLLEQRVDGWIATERARAAQTSQG